MFVTIDLKLGNMRKAQNFVFYPKNDSSDNFAILQSDQRIAKIDTKTGIGLLSKGYANGAYFHHLNQQLGAAPVKITSDQLIAINEKFKTLQSGPVRIS